MNTLKQFTKEYIWLSDNAKEVFSELPLGKKSKHISHADFTEPLNDFQILERGVKTVSLADIFALIEKQKNGEEGTLLNNGYMNIFYVQDGEQVLFVSVGWSADRGRWLVYCGDARAGTWDAGNRVFSATAALNLGTELSPSYAQTLEDAIRMVKEAGYEVFKRV